MIPPNPQTRPPALFRSASEVLKGNVALNVANVVLYNVLNGVIDRSSIPHIPPKLRNFDVHFFRATRIKQN